HTLAFDVLRGRTVLFGGIDGGGALIGDTWEWDGTNWAQRLPTTSPPSRQGSGMAYDLARACTVLFAGRDQNDVLGDTWEGTGGSGPRRVLRPPARDDAAAVYDPVRARTVLFGGGVSVPTPMIFADTWEWDGTLWHAQTPATAPASRVAH